MPNALLRSRTLFLVPFFAIALLACSLASTAAASFDQGMAAFETDDFSTAFKLLKPVASKGNVTAQFSVGYMYYTGQGVSQSSEQAAIWYKRAAAQGDASAQYNLGYLFATGDGVKRDFSRAAKLFEQAARQDHPLAQNNLGLIYEEGLGVQQNFRKALSYYSRAAGHGLSIARDNYERLNKKLARDGVQLAAAKPAPQRAAPKPRTTRRPATRKPSAATRKPTLDIPGAVPSKPFKQGRTLVVQGSNVNVRAKPHLKGLVLTRVNTGDEVTEVKRKGDWVLVVTQTKKSIRGWVYKTLVR